MKKPDLKKTLSRGRESFGTKSVKYGSYSALMIAIVIVIVIVANLIAANLPESIKTVDLSANKVYSIGNDTEKVLDGLKKDVTITVLSSKADADSTLKRLLANYDESSRVKVKYTDPSSNPSVAGNYSDLTEGSVIVKCGSKEQTIDSGSIYTYDSSSYSTTGNASQAFDGEGQITSAIQYVTADKLPKLYAVTGHGEQSLPSSVSSLLKKQNMDVSELNLMSSNGIPADCDCLLIYAPTSDYSADEADMVKSYLDGGGRVMVLDNYTDASMKNFNSILEAYGIKVEDGLVMESANHYYQQPMYLIPSIASSDVTKDLADKNLNILVPEALGFSQNNADGVTVTPLLQTSDGAYIKKVSNGQISSTAKEDGDVTGQFGIAYLAARNSEGSGSSSSEADGSTGELIAVSAASLINESVTNSFSLGNLDFFTDCMSYLTNDGKDGVKTVSIDAKSLTAENITVSAMQAVTIGAVVIVIIPVIILVCGIIVWNRRRKQ